MSLLRQFIFESLMEGTLLLEGVLDQIKEKSNREDKEWDEAHEYLSRDIPQAKLKQYLLWLQKIAQKTQEPLRDIVPLLPSFHKRKEMRHLKGRDADINSYKNVADLQAKLEEISDVHIDYEGEVNKIRTKTSADADVVYESDNFIVYFPKTEKGSVVLGKGTSWCTARTDDDNMFANYAFKDTFLFYVFSKQNNEKWSIGLWDGKLIESTDGGGATVDKDNEAFTIKKQKQTFDSEYEKIISSLKKYSAKYSHEHPSMQLLIDDKGQSDKKFMQMLRFNYGADVSENMKKKIEERIWKIIKKDDLEALDKTIMNNDFINSDMLDFILRNSSHTTLQKETAGIMVGHDIKMSSKRIEILYNRFKKDRNFLFQVGHNLKTPLKIIKDILATYGNTNLGHNAAANLVEHPNATKKDLLYIINNIQGYEWVVNRARKRLAELSQT